MFVALHAHEFACEQSSLNNRNLISFDKYDIASLRNPNDRIVIRT